MTIASWGGIFEDTDKIHVKVIFETFFMGLAGFIVFVSVEWLYQISDYIIRNRVGFSKLLVFIAYNIPYFAVLGIPVGVLFAIFWVISDLYSNREITALLVHGVSSKKLVTPFFILAVVLSTFILIPRRLRRSESELQIISNT